VPVALDIGGRVRCHQGVTTIANREQADAWNGDEGAHWAANADRYNASTAAYDHPLFAAVRIQPTDVVLDVGCGCGSTTRAAARHASAGSATGVDLSAPMLEVARAQAKAEGLTNVTFTQADAQVEPFPTEYDAVISRFGAMFFGDLAAAFANLGRALEPGGRLGVVAWTSLDRNEWLTAIRAALAAGRDLPAPPPGVPGPFGLGDGDRTRAWLTAAGFRSIAMEEVQGAFFAGADADDAFGFLAGTFPVRGMLQPLGDDARRAALDELRATVAAHETADGVRFGSSAWLITAVRG
jgi:SAM-dependent methyltransferase